MIFYPWPKSIASCSTATPWAIEASGGYGNSRSIAGPKPSWPKPCCIEGSDGNSVEKGRAGKVHLLA